MFDRGNDYNSGSQLAPLLVELTLLDGCELKGQIMVPRQGGLNQVLNSDKKFVEFHNHKGDIILLAISAIQTASARNLPENDHIKIKNHQYSLFDPYQMLGVKQNVNEEDLSETYRKKLKLYHPDRYQNTGLPAEVMDYLEATSKRINAAYNALRPSEVEYIGQL